MSDYDFSTIELDSPVNPYDWCGSRGDPHMHRLLCSPLRQSPRFTYIAILSFVKPHQYSVRVSYLEIALRSYLKRTTTVENVDYLEGLGLIRTQQRIGDLEYFFLRSPILIGDYSRIEEKEKVRNTGRWGVNTLCPSGTPDVHKEEKKEYRRPVHRTVEEKAKMLGVHFSPLLSPDDRQSILLPAIHRLQRDVQQEQDELTRLMQNETAP